ncbi:MAG: DNA repair protein RecN [Bacteroidales bacterium]|nr:DNA repair protein RecN [Bacteroidales bacterium]
MLGSLHIENYILIDSLDISFPEGLVIITGQTGAGKSILLGALSLVAGAKADATMISDGKDSCVVEAEFDGADEKVRSLLDENDVEWDDGHLIIRRVVNRSGRSRCFVNDCPVTVQLLADLSASLVDVHSQHKSLLLTDHAFQLSILDHYAGNAELVAGCRSEWQNLQGLRSQLASLKDKLQRADAESDYVSAQYRQLEAAGLRAGELEELEAEQKSLAGAEQIKEALSAVSDLFDPSSDDRAGIAAGLREAQRQLERLAKFLPEASDLAGRLESSRIELEDISSEVGSLDRKIDLSPEHLEAVDNRLSLLYTLLKKHGCNTVEELVSVRDGFANAVSDNDTLAERIEDLEKEVASATIRYDRLCEELHSRRTASAGGFADAILDDLRFLELDRSAFSVSVQPCAPGACGKDAAAFLFSATGANPQDVSKCASGGEISRIMLCLKAMMAKFVGMPTLIFDEIDTGVSGSVADKMGRMICRMGGDMQVFSITHLPQVAAKGSAHYVVSKEIGADGVAHSSIRKVEGAQRVNEIARLLSGATITDAAVANAKSLLDNC